MRKHSFEIVIGFLVAISVLLVLALGYFSYTQISTIVSNINNINKPDEKLSMIKTIAMDLDQAENSIRLYAFTKNKSDLHPFNTVIVSLDEQIENLQEAGADNQRLMNNIDTISELISDKIYVWREMLSLYDANIAEQYLDTISNQLETKIESDSIRKNRGLLKKIFQRKKKQEIDEEKIIKDIAQFKEEDKRYTTQVKQKELKLAQTNNQLTIRIYSLIDKMEEDELSERQTRANEATLLAEESYRWIGWFSLSVTLMALLVIIVILRYVRKSRKTQRTLESAKIEAENLAKAKELFTANVSHELRTPMNVISGFLNQLLKSPLDEQVRSTLNIIKSSSDHLVRIINDILDFSKMQSGKMQLELTHFNPHNLIDEVQLLFNNQAKENNTNLVIIIEAGFPETLIGDPIRLKQILINLVGNAIKFTKNGTVTCSINSESKISGNLVMNLVVEDTGIGIDKDNLDKIFSDFTQAEQDTSRRFGGTGLGLSIVKQLIDIHHGTIQVVSDKNKGSKFICKIPYKIGNPAQVAHPIAENLLIPESIKQLKVLIVDDEVYNRKLIKTILNRWEVQNEEAEDGMDAIEKIKDQQFDFILMDVRMPGLDGFKVTRFIRETLKLPSEQTAVILISGGNFTKEDVVKYKDQGIDDYLPKPFAEGLLLNSILNILKSRKGGSQIANYADREKVIDNDEYLNLDELYRVADNDDTFVLEMLERFQEAFEKGMDDIREGILQKDWQQIGNAAHKMASPCRHIGARPLLEKLKKIESLSNEKRGLEEIKNLVPLIEEEYIVVKGMITNHISSLKN